METRERFELWKQTKLSKKLKDVLEFSEEFIPLINQEVSALPLARPLEAFDLEEDRDLTVCVRVRPRHQQEEEAWFFQSVFVQNPYVLALESSFDFRNAARVVGTTVETDIAFGPEVNNELVYSQVGSPLIKLASQGGVGCVFVYGQKGAGKTYTAQGILEGLADELFKEKLNVRLHASLIEIVGNNSADLLNEKVDVDIVEDKFGMVSIVEGVELEIESSSQFKDKVYEATRHRWLDHPLAENPSSVSHFVSKIRFENIEFRNVKDGAIYVVDLASADSPADAPTREAVQINLSLTALKDCIKNRLTEEIDPQVQYLVTYRQSRLTLLLKEAFDLGMKKPCKIVLIGCVSPTIADIVTTQGTLKYYVMPLKTAGMKLKEKVEDPDSKNPVHWPNEEIKDWILENSGANVCVLCPWESGRDLLRVPEVEFIRRVLAGNTGLGEGQAVDLYNRLWTIAVLAKKNQWKASRVAMERATREEDKDKDIITKIIEIGDMTLVEEPPRNTAGETVLVFNNEENMERYEKKNKTMLKNEQKRKMQAHERSEAKMFKVLDVTVVTKPIGELVKIPPYKKPEKMIGDVGDKFGEPTAPKFYHQPTRLRRKSEGVAKSTEFSHSRRNSVANISQPVNKRDMLNTKRRNSVANLNQPRNNPFESRNMAGIRRNSVANLCNQVTNKPTENKKRRNSVVDTSQPNNNPALNGRNRVLDTNQPNNNPVSNRRNSITNIITISKDGSIQNTICCMPRKSQGLPHLKLSQPNIFANNDQDNEGSSNSSSSSTAPKSTSINGKRNLTNESRKNRRNSVANITHTSPAPKSKVNSLSSNRIHLTSRKNIPGNNTSERRGTPSLRPIISRRNSVASIASDVTNATYTVDKFRNKFYIPL